MTSIFIDFRYQSILIGGLNRLIYISIDFRYRLLSINYIWFITNAWIWSITISNYYNKRLPFSYQAFFKGKLKIKGNMGLAMKLREIQPKAGKSKL